MSSHRQSGNGWAAPFAEVVPEHPVLQVVTGDGSVGAALCLAGVDKIGFTGSTATGKKVMAACAETLTPVLMECGGKDALILDADGNVGAAADAAVWGALSNSGQTCLGVERVYVHEHVYGEFIDKTITLAARVHAGPGAEDKIGPITMPSQVAVIRRHIDDAIVAAVDVSFSEGSARSPASTCNRPSWSTVPEDSLAVTEETFGPTMTITKVASMDEAVELVNASPYALGASVFGKDGAAVADRLRSGGASVNSYVMYAAVPNLPLGGVGASGFGTRSRPRWSEGVHLRSFDDSATIPFAPTTDGRFDGPPESTGWSRFSSARYTEGTEAMTGRLSAIAGTVRDLGIPLPGRRTGYDVAGKVVLITGGGDGIGAALARTLHRRGATVALIDVNQSSLAAAERAFGSRRVVTVTADVRDRDGMKAAARTIVEQLGRIDVVVANAGITPPPATLRQIDPDAFDRVLDVNLTGVFNTVHPTNRRGDPQQWAHRRRVIGGVVRPRFGRRFVHDQQGWGRSARPGAASRGCRLRRYCRRRVLRDGGYTTCTRHTRRRRDRPQTRRSTTRSPPSSNLPGQCRDSDRRRDRSPRRPDPCPRCLGTLGVGTRFHQYPCRRLPGKGQTGTRPDPRTRRQNHRCGPDECISPDKGIQENIMTTLCAAFQRVSAVAPDAVGPARHRQCANTDVARVRRTGPRGCRGIGRNRRGTRRYGCIDDE